jgi:heme-degrading monooxygenase HmoA
VIARVWRGWTTHENADLYEAFLLRDLFPKLRAAIEGFHGGHVLRRADDAEVEFLIITVFDSLDDVRRFAGEDHEQAVIEPEAARLLLRGEPRVRHYELCTS